MGVGPLQMLLAATAVLAVDRSPYRLECRKLLKNLQKEKETSPAVLGSSITYAASKNCPAVIEMLLEKDETLANFEDAPRRTALVSAAEAGSMEAQQVLLKYAGLENKNNALLAATIQTQDVLVRLLLDAGAEVDTRDSLNGATPLMHAARKRSYMIAKILLDAGANVSLTIPADAEMTAVDYAVLNDDAHMAIMLAKGASMSIKHHVILRSALRGALGTFKACIDAGFGVDSKNQNDATPLILAAANNHSAIVAEALRNNASVDGKMKNGVTALIAAARAGFDDIVLMLIEAGADIDIQADGGMSALMLAALLGHEQAVNTLLKHNGQVNMRNDQGATAFVFAAEHKHKAVMDVLLKGGAEDLLAPAPAQDDRELFETIVAACAGVSVVVFIVCCFQMRSSRSRHLQRARIREEVIALYRKHNPKKEKDVDELLDAFQGHEAELLTKVKARYDGQQKGKKKNE